MQYQQMRFGGGPLTPAVKAIIIANCSIFALSIFFFQSLIPNFTVYFGLVPILVTKQLFLWQFFTYMFLHGGLGHLFFNMFALWMFGSDVERLWGTRPFVTYYVICGVGAGLFNFILSHNSMHPIIGSSGAVYGLLAAYAIYYGHRELYFFFMFPIKAGVLVAMLGVIELLSGITYTQSGIAHMAHLGGLLVGFIYISVKYNRGWTDLVRLWHQYQRRKNFRNRNGQW